ncbi:MULTISPECIES: amidohydrolase [unclassified Ruegeria]|uniref:amidohydrolase n=1 Tax=unclassified Ruegeria TaxID=2625375 RepID=UPI00147A90A5|nr:MULTISPECIES: amidohydrolase [unclassified Ruegeria]NOD36028.1 amidohydrolase family protein [Ruegeria sp. HKCCD7296]NOE43421.1 amidohydrolase family protein [Ruegeria sp. HKCCD7319]
MKNLTVLGIAASILTLSSANAQEADTIYTGGTIFTVNAEIPLAEAVAIKNRKFIAVGSAESVENHRGPETQVVDLNGGFAMPGIIDVHMHPFEDFHRDSYLLGIEDNSTPESILAEIKAYADANPDKEWIIGGSWPPGMFPDEAPTRELLDSVIPDRPVFIQDQSAHSVWMNTKALELSGIMAARDADLPDGSVVVRDGFGVPSGTIREFAIGFARRSMPPFPKEEMIGTARGFQDLFHSLGITSVKAAAGYQSHIDAVHALNDAGEWKLRMHMAMSYNYYDAGSTLDEQIETIQSADDYVLDFFDPRGFKIFLDGTPPTREGWLVNPYPGTDNFGVHYYSPADLLALYSLATEMDRVVMAHGTGDRSVRESLNAIKAVKKAFPESDIRHHPTHNGLIREEDIKRFADLGLTIELSPIVWFPSATVKTFEDVMGRMNVAAYTNPRRLLDAGAEVAFASDWSVGPLDPWARIGFLVSRVRPDDPESGPFFPQNAVTASEAIRASTLGPAHVIGVENETGSIEVGKFADMIVLDRDITKIESTDIKNTKVLRTVFAGEEVYLAEE